MERHKRQVAFVLALSVFFAPLALHAETAKPGDVAQNLKVVPPWTMRLCDVGARLRVLQAVYQKEGALKLKKLDADCYLWRESVLKLKLQLDLHRENATTYKKALLLFDKQLKAEQQRNEQLVRDIKKEIAEKNKYKYKPTYGWIGWVAGGGIALVAVGILVGVVVAKD